MLNLNDLLVCIIAVDGKPRNSRLTRQAKIALLGSKIVVVDAITPKEIEPKELFRLIDSSSKLLGRQIGKQEIAVMLSHRKCYDIFRKSSKKYLLVLEDDVEINTKYIDMVDVLNLLQTNKPTVVSLYSPKWSIWKHTSLGLRAKIQPAYAAAYFINIKSIGLALSSKPIGLADWPPWAIKTRFYLRNYLNITCLENDSLLEKNRNYDKAVKMKKVLLRKSGTDINKKLQILYIIVYPLIWKWHKLMRFIFTLKLNNNKIISKV